MKYDFSGYATKNDFKCTDGRTIRKGAFKHNDGKRVPLVWQHMHSDPENILGHAILENREDGVYAYGVFNDTPAGKTARVLVAHGDIVAMSIYANQLQQKGGDVLHGNINEVSLVTAGANPGALIDTVTIAHADGSYTDLDDEAIIYFDAPLSMEHGDLDEKKGEPKNSAANQSMAHADDGKTVGDVFNSLSEEQKQVVYYMIGKALEESPGAAQHSDEGGDSMKFNAFEGAPNGKPKTLTHAQFAEIVSDAQKKFNGSLKDSFLAHAADYGIDDIESLFPEATDINTPPAWIKRKTEWVAGVLNGARHSPFSRIRSRFADITADEARAKGYTKSNRKTEEVFTLLRRVTGPTTVYKKQKLDRDDIIDITDFNVVPWIKGEMRMMLDEELARAVMIGDGRPALKADGNPNEDKIDENCIRPIWTEDELFAIHKTVNETGEAELEAILRAMEDYDGSGSPVLYTYQGKITDWLLLRDKNGRRLYETEAQLASFLGVERFVKIPLFKDQTRKVGKSGSEKTLKLTAIIVDLRDYTIGADKGGQVAMFDDFDIDYNQYKYLIETRMSGCLTVPKSALIVESEVTSTAAVG